MGAAAEQRSFVGRRNELAELIDLIPEPGSSGALRVIVGQAGIGKTRLAAEAATVARERGCSVVWGRCWDEGIAQPYWPWVQVIRSISGERRGLDLAQHVLGGSAGADRFELFDATVRTLEDAAAESPLLIVLDDLHDADSGSLLMTRFLLHRIHELPALVIATHRPVDPTRIDAVAHLDALGSDGRSIPLTGLGIDEVSELLEDQRAAPDVHRVTGGNPLFVMQVSRPRTPVGSHVESLAEVVAARIDALPDATRRVVEALAVFGGVESARDLAGALDSEVSAVRDALAAAIDSDLVVPTGLEFGFSHPLIAEVALDRLDRVARESLHRAAAELIADDPARRADHARHLLGGGAEVRREAIEGARVAASEASDALAHEEAAEVLHRALDAAAELENGGDHTVDRLRLSLLLELGEANWRANRSSESIEAYESAWELALLLDDADGLGRAALRSGIQYYFDPEIAAPDARRTRIALEVQPDEPSALVAMLHAQLAMQTVTAEPTESRRSALRALGIARSVGDAVALGHALIADQITALGPSTLGHRIDTAHEIIAIARSTGHPALLIQGRFLLMGALLERGDIRGLDDQLAVQSRVLEELAEPRTIRHSLWFRCMRAILDGRSADAEALAHECFEVSMRFGDPDGIGVFGGQLGVVRWMADRLMELEPLYLERRANEPNEPLWSAVVAYLWATHDQPTAARGALDDLPDLSSIVEGQYWLLTMSAAAEAAAIVGSEAQRRAFREALLPYVDHVVPIGMGAALWGTVARPLGLLASSLDRPDEAIAFLRRAVEVCGRLGARPWLVEAQVDLAGALLARDPDDPQVGPLVAEAIATADQIGMVRQRRRIEAMAIDRGAAVVREHGSGDRWPSISVLGTFEARTVDGDVATWSSRKARQLLMILIARRGAPVHREQLIELLWPDDVSGNSGNRLDVAVSMARGGLDPRRSLPSDALIAARGGTVRLQFERISIDVEDFLDRVATVRRDPGSASLTEIAELARSYTGEAFPDEPYADWATSLRTEASVALGSLLRLLAERAAAEGDDLVTAEACRRLLDIDPFDEPAHRGLIAALQRTGSHGLAKRALDSYERALDEVRAAPIDQR